MRLVFVISSLSSGGAERVISELANACSNRGFCVRLVTVSGTDTDFYSLVPEIDRVALDSRGPSDNVFVALARNWQRIRRLRHAVKSFNPDSVLVFGARTNVLALMALRGLGAPIVVSERTDPFALDIGFPWQQLRPLVYRDAARVVAQTQRVAGKISDAWSLRQVDVIPNPLAKELPDEAAISGKRSNVLLSVGRLSREKGHDILLDAWAKVRPEFPDWRLRLVGDGPERGNLEAQATRLGLGEYLEFAGQTRSVWPEYLSAQVFVLPSRREGFPNALLEALACGCVCIASDCSSGPAELLKNGELGRLYAPNTPEKLVEALRNTLRESSEGSSLDVADEVRRHYAIDTVAEQWISMLMRVRRK